MKNKQTYRKINLEKLIVARITPGSMHYIKGGDDDIEGKQTSHPTIEIESQNHGHCIESDLLHVR